MCIRDRYSYSDRARYYIGRPEVVAAMNKLFDNLREYPIPMNMLHQYMPISYAKIREGKLKLDPRELAMDLSLIHIWVNSLALAVRMSIALVPRL